ncbi:MAG: class I SAM-dependent methyltransferase [Candidatus Gracilibacteria bacterium]|nr:class I SAM-dependent methyltransferase [Candidatus Gracilibacteria bacterium]
MSSQIISLHLKKIKSTSLKREIPNISEQNAEFLKNLIQEKNPKHILEVGTANGYSTLQFASVLPESSTITTVEYAWNMHNEAIEYFKNCKLKNIHAIWGDAKKVLPTLADEYFDFVFIDAMKKEYLQYLLVILSKCTPDAIIVIDDVEKFRDKMEDLYFWLSDNKIQYTLEKTDEDDSIMILERKSLPF